MMLEQPHPKKSKKESKSPIAKKMNLVATKSVKEYKINPNRSKARKPGLQTSDVRVIH